MLQRFLHSRKIYPLKLVLLVGAVPVLFLFSVTSGYAADLNNRKVVIGTSKPSAVTTHSFSFDLGSSSVLGSIVFEYCSNSPLDSDPCAIPAGLNVSGATNPPTQTGATGFIISPSSTNNKLILSRIPLFITARPVSYSFDTITNPSTPAQAVYVRINTYATNDGSGAPTDHGGVVFSTSGNVGVFSFVPPILVSCTGVVVAPRCTSITGDFVDLGELSSSSSRTATTQFAAATNDPAGYVTILSGSTMTSGNNIIPALTTPQPSNIGNGQFGINLRANNSPSAGQEPSGTGTGIPAANYNIPNRFTFNDGDTFITSNVPTDINIFTLTYLVNVQKSQPAGQYNTTRTLTTVVQF